MISVTIAFVRPEMTEPYEVDLMMAAVPRIGDEFIPPPNVGTVNAIVTRVVWQQPKIAGAECGVYVQCEFAPPEA